VVYRQLLAILKQTAEVDDEAIRKKCDDADAGVKQAVHSPPDDPEDFVNQHWLVLQSSVWALSCVESSPLRTEEMMTANTAARCLELLKNTPSITTTLDIMGGAPELNHNFRYLVKMARRLRPDLDIIDRCNLTVFQEPGQQDLMDFLKEQRVHVIASLPCYSTENVRTNNVVLASLNDRLRRC
jgi:hypothetical protein